LQWTGSVDQFVGWQFYILPWLEQDSLWRQSLAIFAQDRNVFDNPPNIGLSTIISLYCCPSDPRVFNIASPKGFPVAFTSYLGITGLDFRANDGMLFGNSSIRMNEVTDGTSNTLLVGERPPSMDLFLGWWFAGVGQDVGGSAEHHLGVRERRADYVPLRKCQRGPYHYSDGSLNNPCDAMHFWSLHPGGAHFLYVDGSVHFITYSADDIMPALATRAGGEAVSAPN
jgi:prepilin-type processing-associated H-X9-DG protein